MNTSHLPLTRRGVSAGRRPTLLVRSWVSLRGLLGEATALLLLLSLYRWGRTLADGRHQLAQDNAHRVDQLERWLRLPDEAGLQHWLLAHHQLAELANTYYASVHFPFTGGVLVWLYLNRRPLYRRARNALVLMTATGLIIAFAYPLAPPRLMGDLGFVDVAATFGQSVYAGDAAGTSNQYAAMPSLHVGWAVLVGYALFTATRSRALRWVWWLHPVATVLIVVSTGNHFWLDGLVGTALFALALLLVRTTQRERRSGQKRPTEASTPSTASEELPIVPSARRAPDAEDHRCRAEHRDSRSLKRDRKSR